MSRDDPDAKRRAFASVLKSLRAGRPAARDELLALVYDELRNVARGQLGPGRIDGSLQPTALVHEAYLRLVGKSQLDWRSRRHFFSLAARAMRDVIVEHARNRGALKRGGEFRKITLDEGVIPIEKESVEILMLNDAVSRLYEHDRSSAKVVFLRYFAGMSGDETAAVLGVSPATVDRRWKFAKAWLHRELTGNG